METNEKRSEILMTQSKKEKIGIHMNPDLVKRIDAEYPLYGCTSRSDFMSQAAAFYLGFLHNQEDTAYMSKTTLTFLEGQIAKLDAKICRQLFRICVELSMVAHVTACQIRGVTDETLKDLRKRCVKDVKQTIGNIRYDKIYAFQNDEIWTEEDDHEP